MVDDLLQIKTECVVCPTKIWEKQGERLKKSSEYNEVSVQLNDLSNMIVGVCSKHAEPKNKDITAMTEKIHQGWLEEVALGIGNESWVRDRGLALQVTGVNR